jgi:hypothetical protein
MEPPKKSWFRRVSDSVKGNIQKIPVITKKTLGAIKNRALDEARFVASGASELGTYLITDHFKQKAISIIEYKKLRALGRFGSTAEAVTDITNIYDRAIKILNSWSITFERLVNFDQAEDLANYAIRQAYEETHGSDDRSNELTPSIFKLRDWQRVWKQHRGGKGKSRKSRQVSSSGASGKSLPDDVHVDS